MNLMFIRQRNIETALRYEIFMERAFNTLIDMSIGGALLMFRSCL